MYCYLSYFGYKAGMATVQGFWNEMDRLGKDRNPHRVGFLQFVGVAETEREANELYRGPAEYFYGRCLHVNPRWASPPGYSSEASPARARVQSPGHPGGGRQPRHRRTGADGHAGGRTSSISATWWPGIRTRWPSACARCAWR